MTDESDELLDIARMGLDAEAFMRTPLGKFLEGKAKQEEADAMAALIDADPDDVKANTLYRNRIHVARMFLTWMGDSIAAGHAAHDQLRVLDDLGKAQ